MAATNRNNAQTRRITLNDTVLDAIEDIKKNQEEDRRVREERALAAATLQTQLVGDVGQIKKDIIEIKTSAQTDRTDIKKITVIELEYKNIAEWKKTQEEWKTWVNRTFLGTIIVAVAGVLIFAVSMVFRIPVAGSYSSYAPSTYGPPQSYTQSATQTQTYPPQAPQQQQYYPPTTYAPQAPVPPSPYALPPTSSQH